MVSVLRMLPVVSTKRGIELFIIGINLGMNSIQGTALIFQQKLSIGTEQHLTAGSHIWQLKYLARRYLMNGASQ